MTTDQLHTINGLRIDVDGTLSDLPLQVVDGSCLRDLQAALDVRTVDVVQVRDIPGPDPRVLDAWVDDEGLFTSPPNWVGTALIDFLGGRLSQTLHGPMLLLASDPTTGESHSLPAQVRADLTRLAQALGQSPEIRQRVSEVVETQG